MQALRTMLNKGWSLFPRAVQPILLWSAIYFFMVGVSVFLPIRAPDWYLYFLPRQNIYDYPPWLSVLLALIPALPFLSGLTLTGLFYALWRRRARPLHILAAFTTMPVYWVLWQGQVDVVPLLGLLSLPWGIPLVLLKPQVAVWPLWTWWRAHSNKWLIATGTLAFLGLTMIIWGPWPLVIRPPVTIDAPYNLSLWRVWWPLGVLAVMGALLEKDPDRAMALGALAAPYLQGASYFMLVPTLARLRGRALGLVWLTSWASLLVNAFGDAVRPVGALFPIAVWVALFWSARQTREAKEC